jgi:soluble lytic murein transglycosylase
MRSRRLFLLGMALILLFVLVPNLWGRAERLLYPRKYEALVDQWAETYGLDPLLVDAFIRTESGFDPQATSTVDARGLMQMTEETFLWLRSKLGLGEEVSFGDLYDPDVSIRFGCYYLHLCLVRYNGDISTAAAAYHSGWGTVDALLQKEEHSEDGLTLSGFPYNQMHHYVEKITACYAKYTELYGA